MPTTTTSVTYIGGPTAILDFGGLRFLTDPTFDPAGGRYTTGPVTLEKVSGPALALDHIGALDAILLTHDHHADNLDPAGRDLLVKAPLVLTTVAGAERLNGNAKGLAPWHTVELSHPNCRKLLITATPARHGPKDQDRGPVIGFVLAYTDDPQNALYISGDTVWFEGVEQVAQKFAVTRILLFLGAARIALLGTVHLTMTAEEGVHAAGAFPHAAIMPLHFEGWKHFSEGRSAIEGAFASAGLADRLTWPVPGKPVGL